jgi:hypothetical protein
MTVSEPLPGIWVAAWLVAPDGRGQGYARFPVVVGDDGHFLVSGVPVGKWFLQLDRSDFALRGNPPRMVSTVATQLIPITTGAPDLSTLVAARRDLARVRTSTPVTADFSNLEPWVSGAQIVAVSAQADLWQNLYPSRPVVGVTSFRTEFDWQRGFGPRLPGLPDPDQGDVVFLYQRGFARPLIPNGTATVQKAVRYARLDALRIVNGQPATFSVPLIEAPQTGNLSADVKTTRFAELAADVNPRAQLDYLFLGVQAVPHSIQYPDEPADGARPLLTIYATTASDVVLASDYGQFLGPPWQEVRSFGFSFQLNDPLATGYITIREPAQPAPWSVMVPVLSPPTLPRINGQDAFVPRNGVSLQPTISWSPPRIGSPTSYLVTVKIVHGEAQEGDTDELSALVDGATSFQVPPGFLRDQRSYYATITARKGPWDGPGRLPLRIGEPLSTADCVTSYFNP